MAPDSPYIRDHWKEIDQLPLDGIGIHLQTPASIGFRMFSPEVFTHEQFAGVISNLKSAKFSNVQDNFLVIQLGANDTPKDKFKWFDDELWSKITEHFSVMARIAKQGGLRGFILDLEGYAFKPFFYQWNKSHEEKSYGEFTKICMTRGRQVMQAIQKEYPDIQLFLPIAWGSAKRFAGEEPLNSESTKVLFGLVPSFLDGMLDASQPGVQFHVDGEITYNVVEADSYNNWYNFIRKTGGRTLTQYPERYDKQVKVAFGNWIDSLSRNSVWNVDKMDANYFFPKRFSQALKAALNRTDKYVWIYSQQPRFFPLQKVPDAYLKIMEQARQEAK